MRPLFELKINANVADELQVDYVAGVDKPAIERNFLAFDAQNFVEPNANESENDFMSRCIVYNINEGKEQEQAIAICSSIWEQQHKANTNFAEIKDEERIVFGAAMIPNLKIYRKDGENEFDVFFSAETIKEIAVKFFAKGFQNNFNIMHDAGQQMDGVVFFQSVIKDDSKGIQGLQGDYPNGTWFLGAKINNDEVWNKIKSGEIKGFSVEGLFNYKQVPTEQEMIAQLKNAFNENLTNEMLLSKIISIVNGTN